MKNEFYFSFFPFLFQTKNKNKTGCTDLFVRYGITINDKFPRVY